jgi:SAM-dependent methyltransferase
VSAADFRYQGSELELFARAVNWKRYWSAQVRPHLGLRVLEVGAGIGVNTSYLNHGSTEWVCLEPDRKMAQELATAIASGAIPANRVIAGTISELPAIPSFDSVVYVDVLEHIEDDAAELARAAERLRSGGKIIMVGPAHSWLFSEFDRSIGHFRRYSPREVRALHSSALELIAVRQLDVVGILASMANRWGLRQTTPNPRQISVWDRYMVPLSRALDPLFFYRFGKSIMAVWRLRPTRCAPANRAERVVSGGRSGRG